MNTGKKTASVVAALLMVMAFGACSTVTITERGSPAQQIEPTYEKTFSFYLGGLIIGDQDKNPDGYHVDGRQICGGRAPVEMQAVRTPMDTLFTIITLTIYAPRTVKVWCGGGGHV